MLKKLLFLLLIASSAYGQTNNRGVSWILEMCSEMSDCGVIMSAYPKASVLNAGWMELTSNPHRCKCAPTFLSDPRPKRVRIDICNSTCFPERGRQCQPHECFAGMNSGSASAAILRHDPGTFARIDRSIGMAQHDIAGAKPPLEVAIKACLECTLTHDARVKLNEYVKKQFPADTKMVDNPINDHCLPGYLCEKHGTPKGNSTLVADNDGTDYDGIDQYSYWKSNATSYMALGWKGCNNGLKAGEPFKPPQVRANYCSADRDGKDFASATSDDALHPGPIDPRDLAGCRVKLPAPDGPKGFVLKLSEGRTFGVFLAPSKFGPFKTVELRKNGTVIDSVVSGKIGKRFAVPYLLDCPRHPHGPECRERRIYDLSKHPGTYPDGSVLHADDKCWVLEKPRFRID